MIHGERFKRIKTLGDIRQEKIKLRYEMLVAEKDIMITLKSAEVAYSFTSTIARVTRVMSVIKQTFSFAGRILGKLFPGKKEESDRDYPSH